MTDSETSETGVEQTPDHWNVKVYDESGEECETIRGVGVSRKDALMWIFDREGVQAQSMGYDADGKFISGAGESVNWDYGGCPPDTGSTDDLEEYPTEALETLSGWAEQRFAENIPDYGRGKNWLDDDPQYHLWRATRNLADSASDGGPVKLTELGDALNHIAFAAEIEIRERQREKTDDSDTGKEPTA